MKTDRTSLIPTLFNEEFIQATFSNPLNASSPKKIAIRSVEMKNKTLFQVTEQRQQQVFHQNLSQNECQAFALSKLTDYKQVLVCTTTADHLLLTNKKGQTTVIRQKPTQIKKTEAHNRTKNYSLAEAPIPFLIELGVMSNQGKVYPQKMAKFRQINRFLEMVDDTLATLPKKIKVIDFGCGKAYLTFALYHYLTDRGYTVNMTGLDLKTDVIQECQAISDRLGYTGLNFQIGDIASFENTQTVDMVVALHACNTATDAALAKAILWKASVILAAPCCQQELYAQIQCQPLQGFLQYGILKERFAALATDAARALLLEEKGYRTQILEFIDSEHTPKNLLLRAVIGNTAAQKKQAHDMYLSLKQTLSIAPSLEKLAP